MRSVTFLLLLVAVTGATLLAVGGWGVWQSLRDADARSREEMRQRTEVSARALAVALQRPELRDSVDAARRFEFVDGVSVVPSSLGGMLPDGRVGARALESEVRAAFRAVREAGVTACGAIVRELLGRWTPDVAADLSAGVALLAVRGGHDALPVDLIAAAARLPEELAEGLVAALREVPGAAADEIADAVAAVVDSARRQRATIQCAAMHADRLIGAGEFVSLPVRAGGVLLYWPSGEGAGVGAWIDPVEFVPDLVKRGGLDPVPLVGTVTEGVGGVPVVAGAFGLVPPAVAPAGWMGSAGLALIFAALAVLFVGGLLMIGRVVRAETAAMRARSEFLQSVTHELKTPLASIRLLAERLETGRVPAERRAGYYGMLADESQRLTVLIENVLDLGRIERGERAYDRRVQPARAIIEDAVDVFAPLARRDGIEVAVEGEVGDAACKVDRGALMQSLLNVLDNARKYAKDGARVVVRTAVVDGALSIDVRDFGPGIAAEERDALFERFARGARHRDGSIAGVGLGLHLARRILDAHGGSLDCTAPEDGTGALFRFRLPLADRAGAEETVAS